MYKDFVNKLNIHRFYPLMLLFVRSLPSIIHERNFINCIKWSHYLSNQIVTRAIYWNLQNYKTRKIVSQTSFNLNTCPFYELLPM